MKTQRGFMQTYMLALMLVIIFIGCKKDSTVQAPSPFIVNLIGKWQWVKTVTPTGEITPQTSGSTKYLNYGNDGGFGGNYLLVKSGNDGQALYQNNAFGQTDMTEKSIISQFGNKYIKFFMVQSSDNTFQELSTTDLVNDYTAGFGLTRHYYKRVGLPDRP